MGPGRAGAAFEAVTASAITASLRLGWAAAMVAMASNIGSAATITGNPQNIIIDRFSQISYSDFAAALAPVGLALTIVLVGLFHRGEFAERAQPAAPVTPIRFRAS